MSSMSDDISAAAVRAFNRFYTRQIGLLEEHVAHSPYSLAEARVLYEIALRGHTTASVLASALGLDRAYLSRILKSFSGDGLIAISPIPSDRRQNQLALTADGDAAVDALNADSDEAVTALLQPLSDEERRRLTEAMLTIRRLLGDDLPAPPVVLRPHRIGEIGWIIHRQAVLYNRQFGWNGDFETLISRIYHDYEEAPESPPKALWIADRGGVVAGSVFVTPSTRDAETAQLRMLYVEPEARGLGLGTQLVAQAVDFARRSGYTGIRLWTQSVLVSARRIYTAAGFVPVESAPHHSFGQDLEGEYWEMPL